MVYVSICTGLSRATAEHALVHRFLEVLWLWLVSRFGSELVPSQITKKGLFEEIVLIQFWSGGAAIVVKPFIRNRTVIDLPYQTWLLMQKCGFQLTKLFKLRLEQQSFWRILYMKKNPEVPQIWHEYVLVCAKPLDSQKVFSLWFSHIKISCFFFWSVDTLKKPASKQQYAVKRKTVKTTINAKLKTQAAQKIQRWSLKRRSRKQWFWRCRRRLRKPKLSKRSCRLASKQN